MENPANDSGALEALLLEFSAKQRLTSRWPHILLIATYLPLFVLAVTANLLVIIVVLKYHYMRSVTNYFIVNLSVADLLVTFICMPMAVGKSISNLWYFGETMCKLSSYLQGVSVGASVFTLTAMSVDRYLAIRHSMAFRKVFTSHTTIFVVITLWAVPLLIFSPVLWVRRTEYAEIGEGEQIATAVRRVGLVWCIEDWSRSPDKKIYGIVCFVVIYLGPGCLVIAANLSMGLSLIAIKPPFDAEATVQQVRVLRERRRVARLLLLLASLFTLCWLPYSALTLALDLDSPLDESVVTELLPFSLLLGHANSAINPLLYAFMTRNFRRSLASLLCRCGPPRPKRKHSCKLCRRFQPRGVTSSSGYDSCRARPQRPTSDPRCLLGMTTLRNSHQAAAL